jgi:superfamily II DNA or RNA helicase
VKPELLTNRDGEEVADGIRRYLASLREALKDPYELAIATAYFNLGGYSLLADELDHPSRVQILLGAEPPDRERRIRRLEDSGERTEDQRVRRALEGHRYDLALDADLLGFTLDAAHGAHRLVAWLRSDRVEVRRLPDQFLHGKAWIVTTNDDGVVAGSANFTYAGLTKNLELELGRYQPEVVKRVRTWFEELWAQAEDFDLAALYEARFEPHAPWLIYMRMLLERYGSELQEEATAAGTARIHLTQFQEDGVWRAKRILEQRNGVLIADEVGLGKTFLAGELIRQAVQERRQRVLVIASATLRDGPWRKFLLDFQLGVERISYNELREGKHRYALEEYALVVVDEGHNLRNPATETAAALRALLAGTPPKQLVLMTATPVNNSLWDLYYLLSYFVKSDSAFATAGIRSLRAHFAYAMALDPDDLSPAHLFDVLDDVAVRRTRPFVKRYYPNDHVVIDGESVPITFPKARPLTVHYQLDDALPGFFHRFAVALGAKTEQTDAERIGREAEQLPVLTLARYVPSRYRREGGAEAYEVQVAGLLRSGLLKRFESSSYAFAKTCRKMAASIDDFLELLTLGQVATGQALAEWTSTDSDDLEALEDFVSRRMADLEPAALYDVEALKTDAEHDREVLLRFAEEAEMVGARDDPKLAGLAAKLAEIAAQAQQEGITTEEVRDMRKVLVFSYFTDTVDWIMDFLEAEVDRNPALAPYRGRLTAAAGNRDRREEALFGFAPRTTDAPPANDKDLFDIIVATDVLSEGVNLQQARHIINYDLPWNPMRLVQRHGRIDRIGSRFDEVFLRSFFPDDKLEELLQLEERLHRKIKQAARTIGVGPILPGSEVADQSFTEAREEIEHVRQEDASFFEQGGEAKGVMSGEEYRQSLRSALENPEMAERLNALAWGSGSGMERAGAEPGFVFCARVGDRPQPQFRYVANPKKEQPVVITDTLACLTHARPDHGPDTQRLLPVETFELAFAAWERAQGDIVSKWNAASDPRALAPEVPKAMRDAATLIRSTPPPGWTQEQADALVEKLEEAYPERIQRQIRDAMRSREDANLQAAAIATKVDELGLEPSPAPVPLPPITADDVHLVCWLAIVAAESSDRERRADAVQADLLAPEQTIIG